MKTSIHTVCQFTGVLPKEALMQYSNSFYGEEWNNVVWSNCLDASSIAAGSTVGVELWSNAVLALSTITLRHTP